MKLDRMPAVHFHRYCHITSLHLSLGARNTVFDRMIDNIIAFRNSTFRGFRRLGLDFHACAKALNATRLEPFHGAQSFVS
jgi:hypothetical protein